MPIGANLSGCLSFFLGMVARFQDVMRL